MALTDAQVISKFPAPVVQAHREILMLPLLTRLVNGNAPKAHAAAGSVLRALMGKLDPEQLDQVRFERGVIRGVLP